MILGFEIFQLSRTCQKLGHFIVLCNCLSEDLLNKIWPGHHLCTGLIRRNKWPFISHCTFDVQFENGTKVPEESFQIKTSIGKSSSNDYIVVGKNVEGKFSAKFSDGSSKDFYLYYRSKNETVASYNTTLQDTFEKTIGKKSCLKILYSSQFVVSSKKSNFEISLNFKIFF